VQDIADRANVGRTTFYLHYTSKDALFMSCHEAMVSQFRLGPLYPLSRDEWPSDEAPQGMRSSYRHLQDVRELLLPIVQGKDGPLILRRLRDWNAQAIAANLRTAFPEANSSMPLDILASYLAGAQIALVQWWLEKHQSHSPEELAKTFHRLQRAAIRDAFGLSDCEQAQ